MDGKRSDWVDHAKAIGICLVVYGHVSRGLISSDILPGTDQLRMLDSVIYSFHMPLFFFLSGIFFLKSLGQRSTLGFIANKMDTIAYPYLLWSLIQGVIEVNLSKQKTVPVTYAEVAALFHSPRAQFWFLYVLFFTMVFSALLYFRKKRADSFLIAVAAIIFYIRPLDIQYDSLVGRFASNFVFFSFGVFAGKFMDIQRLKRPVQTAAWLAMAVALQLVFHGILGKTYLDIGMLSLLVATASILGVAVITLQLGGGHHPILKWIGQNSMSIFLMHILAAAGMRIILNKGFGIGNPWLHLGLGMVAGIFFPLWLMKALGDKGRWLMSAPSSISAERLHARWARKNLPA